MSKVLHGDRVMARQSGTGRRGRAEGVVVEVLERANRRVVGRLVAEHGICFVVAEDKRISQDVLVPNDGLAGAKPGQVVVAEIIQQPDRHIKPLGRVVEVLGNYADPGMEIEIALRKHDLPYEFPRCHRGARGQAAEDGAQDRPRRARRSARPAAGDNRRRDRQGLRRRGVLPSGGQGLSPVGGDRRRQPLRAGRRCARHRGARARQLGVFSAPRDPDAAGGVVERLVLAQSAGGPVVHDVRAGGRPARRNQGLPLLSGGDAFAGAADLHDGGRCARRRGGRGARARCYRICRTCTPCTKCWSRRVGGAAQSTSRRSRRGWSSTIRARSPRSTRLRATTPTA